MSKLTKSFTDAFTQASKKDKGLTEGHKKQLDALHAIVDEISADGAFTAEIKPMGKVVPVLEITQKSDGLGQSFFIEFGHDVFGGTPTLKLSTGLGKAPLGKEEGYNIQYENERDALLKEIGKEVARKRGALKLGEAAVAYAAGKKAPTA